MENIATKSTGDNLTAVEWNQVPDELENLITSMGITLSSGDLTQVRKAIAGYAAQGDFYTDSGAADAYVLSVIGSQQAPAVYTQGMRVRFIPGNDNTGPSTINVAGLGAKNIKTIDGNALVGGEMSTTQICELQYDGTDFRVMNTAASVAVVTDMPVISKTGTYNVIADDAGKLIDCPSGTFTITLLAPATAGDGFLLGVRNTGSGAVTVTDGSYTRLIPSGCSVLLTCDGSAYKEVAKGGFEIGENQTWQDVTGSRSYGVVYTNTTGKTITVHTEGTGTSSGSSLTPSVDGVGVDRAQKETSTSTTISVNFIVPDGSTYQVVSSGITKTLWTELR